MRVRKAVFPAAGWGTRFLPATKAQPKEMLPLVDKPIIQYAVEEAVAAGIEQVIIVTSSQKRAIEDHFDLSYELEHLLEEKGDIEMLRQVRHISDLAQVAYVRQKEQLGPRPRGPDGQGPHRPRAVRGHPAGRRRRRRSAVHRPAHPRLQPDPRVGRRGHGGPPRGDRPVRRHRRRAEPRTRSTTAGCTGSRRSSRSRTRPTRRRTSAIIGRYVLTPEDLRQARADPARRRRRDPADRRDRGPDGGAARLRLRVRGHPLRRRHDDGLAEGVRRAGPPAARPRAPSSGPTWPGSSSERGASRRPVRYDAATCRPSRRPIR